MIRTSIVVIERTSAELAYEHTDRDAVDGFVVDCDAVAKSAEVR
jgi:hypothetical protein